jgi:hypothetical protein
LYSKEGPEFKFQYPTKDIGKKKDENTQLKNFLEPTNAIYITKNYLTSRLNNTVVRSCKMKKY